MLIIELTYLLSTALLALYGMHSLFNTMVYWRQSRKRSDSKPATPTSVPDDQLPIVTVQLPIYNERYVINRLLDACVRLDWPRDRLQIQVLDDSSDETVQITAEAVARHRGRGVWIEHVRRADRQGYKAGALEYGLKTAAGEIVAIFDADFIPPADFLRQTVPSFDDPTVGCVQTRWAHVNRGSSYLTRAQALGIDGHFTIEQQARHSLGAFLNFNGTAGLWRRSCMEDAGGWQGDTLTEDLDLSYRAQLDGWRIVYLPDVAVPAELPVQIDAFKRQQFRWAKGSIQTTLKLSPRLWRSDQPLWRKVLGNLHMTGYLAHPLMLLNLLLILPITFSRSPLLLLAPVFSLSTIGPPLMYWMAMRARDREPVGKRLLNLGILVAMGTGLAVNNTKAAIEAVTGRQSAFKRTPKFAVTETRQDWQHSNYTLPRDPTSWIELLLAIYAVSLLVYGVWMGLWWLLLWTTMYASGFIFMTYLSFAQALQLRSVRPSPLSIQPAETRG